MRRQACRKRGRHRSRYTPRETLSTPDITEKVRGPQAMNPGTCVPHLQRIFKMEQLVFLFFLIFLNHFCFFTHITNDFFNNKGPLVQSLKLCQKANSSPPWGLALNLPGLCTFCGTHEEASACDSPRVSVSLPPALRRVDVSLLVFMPFCSSVNRFCFCF